MLAVVQVIQNIKVLGFHIDPNTKRVTTVKTDQGDIKCDEVVNCAGQWARNIGESKGLFAVFTRLCISTMVLVFG